MNEHHKLEGMGWERDLPDFRDYTAEATEIKSVLAKSQPLKETKRFASQS